MGATAMTKKLNRYFTIMRVVLVCMPFACLAYLGVAGVWADAQGALQASPTIAITFLSAMVQPYVALLLKLVQRRLEDGREAYALLNLVLLFVAEIMFMSWVGIIGMLLLIYLAVRQADMGPVEMLAKCKLSALVREVGGSILVLLLASICLFASIRVGFLPF